MRQIDMSKPLSDEDREWLMANNGEEQVRRNAEEHGLDLPEGMPNRPAGTVTTGAEPSHLSDRLYPTGLTPATAEADLDRQRREAQFQAALDAERPEDDPDVDQSGEASPLGTRGLTVETDDNPYESWKGDALKAELEKRELSKSGNKDELAARLRADDEERAEAAEDETAE